MPVNIASCNLNCKSNISKKEDYFVDLEANNFENELYFAVDAAGLNNFSGLSGCLYTNADNAQDHLITKLISTLANYKDSKTPINLAREAPVFMY